MDNRPGDALHLFFERLRDDPILEASGIGHESPLELAPGQLTPLYAKAIAIIEQRMWRDGRFGDLPLYQHLFREMEGTIAGRDGNRHHKFIIAIPVADRPQHLDACLQSLLELCRAYHYGGVKAGRFEKVAVLVVDDSREEENRARHRRQADALEQRGIEAHYLGPEEQWALVERFGDMADARSASIFGRFDREAFFHKGPSVTRNIAYLKMHELSRRGGDDPLLFWFVDSDQEFRVNVATPGGEEALCAINYLRTLDGIFNTTNARVLTGKVVGDPPVSPAVMSGRFLDDVASFLARMGREEPGTPCRFHAAKGGTGGDAAYHDMADLFGFKADAPPSDYRCGLHGPHDHARSFAHFSAALSRFFDGEHPTRRTVHQHQAAPERLVPARTIYTGNYVLSTEGLRYFIPFAPLKLRMAGPVLGRLIKARAGDRFVSANLPLLHRRTVGDIGRSEFRPGIRKARGDVDLSGEFERQFFGDVMLFAVERLTAEGDGAGAWDRSAIDDAVTATEAEMYRRYLDMREAIQSKLGQVRSLLEDEGLWWNRRADMRAATQSFRRFIANMERNFGLGAIGYELIGAGAHKGARLQQIVEALSRFHQDQAAWNQALDGPANPQRDVGGRRRP